MFLCFRSQVMYSNALLDSVSNPNVFGAQGSYTSEMEAIVKVCVEMKWDQLIFLGSVDAGATRMRTVSFSLICFFSLFILTLKRPPLH